MELEVLRYSGFPDSSVISIRAGSTRRQGQLSGLDRPFKFPCKPEDCTTFKVDVLDVLGSARLACNPTDAEYCFSLEPVSRSGASKSSMEVAFAVRRLSGAGAPGGEGDDDKARDQKKEGAALDYLEKHGLATFMQFLMQSLMKDKPTDPYAFLQREVTKRMVVEVTKNAEDQGLENLLAKFAAQAPKGVSPEQLAVLEAEATAVGEQLRADNARLRDTTDLLLSRYGQLIEESQLLQRCAVGRGMDLEPFATAQLDPGAENSEAMQLAAYKDIVQMQDEVNALAKENGFLVTELAGMLSSIHTVKADIETMQQALTPQR